MSRWHAWHHHLRILLRGEVYAREVEREIAFHLELESMHRRHAGSAAVEAELAARRAFGNVTYCREEVRRMTPLRWLDALRQDAAYACRGLARSPMFTAGVVITLALGLGVNAAMFSFLDQLFVRAPAGVVAPGTVRRLYVDYSRVREPGGRAASPSFTYPAYRTIRSALDSAIPLAIFSGPDSMRLIDGRSVVAARLARASRSYFSLLGIVPERGRFFASDEDQIERPAYVAVLSDAYWRQQFHGDSSVLGHTVRIGGQRYTIIGVAAPEFTGVDVNAADIWAPLNTFQSNVPGEPEPWYDTFHGSFRVITRIADSRREPLLLARATAAFRTLHLSGLAYDSTATILAGPIEQALGPAKQQKEVSIGVRLGGVALIVLLVAIANVANLLVVRSLRRRREIAVRRALGVSGVRLASQFITESVALALLSGVAAVFFAVWAGTALRRLLLPSIHWADAAVGWSTVGFIAATALLTGVVAGLAPALRASRSDFVGLLSATPRDVTYRRSRLRASLLVAQIACSIALLVGAGLFVRSLQNVKAIDLGYDVEHTAFLRPSFLTVGDHRAQLLSAVPQLVERLRAVPGVEAVAWSASAPMRGYAMGYLALPDRDSLPQLGKEYGESYQDVSRGYFAASGVPILAGRDFTPSEVASRSAVIVSRAMAKLFWPGANPLSKCLIINKKPNSPCVPVVGVVADVHRMSVIEDPILQYYLPAPTSLAFDEASIVIRTTESRLASVSVAASREMRQLIPDGEPHVTMLAQALEPQLRPWRLGATLFAALGILALVVAAVGVYSVVAYGVSQRTQEMGVRIALGARAHDIIWMVVREGTFVLGIGVIVGVALSVVLSRLVASLLYGISARDPGVLATASVVLAALTLLASALPAWRASRLDPVTALRTE
jgi:putative ABC transport system permease protein